MQIRDDRRITSGRNFVTTQLSANNPNIAWRLDANGNTISGNTIDRQHNVIADQQLFTFFSTKH
jgi:hypothetical protein